MTMPVQGDPANNPPVSTDPTQIDPPSNDPPYASYLSEIPEALRPQVEGVFKKWDGDVTQRFQSLHSEYDPYKNLVDQYEAESLQHAVDLANYMQENPQEFLRQFAQANGINLEQGTQPNQPPQQQVQQQQVNEDEPWAPQLAALQAQNQQMLQALQAQQQQQQEAQARAQIEGILSNLHTQHGNFDDVYVLTLMGQGMDPNSAVKQFQNLGNAYFGGQQPNNQAPTLTPAGGHSTPQISAEDLASGKVNSKDLVVQMLKNAAQQG